MASKNILYWKILTAMGVVVHFSLSINKITRQKNLEQRLAKKNDKKIDNICTIRKFTSHFLRSLLAVVGVHLNSPSWWSFPETMSNFVIFGGFPKTYLAMYLTSDQTCIHTCVHNENISQRRWKPFFSCKILFCRKAFISGGVLKDSTCN